MLNSIRLDSAVTLGRVNGHDLEELLARAKALGDGAHLRLKGELSLRSGLRAERVNGRPVSEDDVTPGHLLVGPDLRVGRLQLARLNGRRLDDYFDAALSRHGRQTLAGSLLLNGTSSFAYLAADSICGRDLRRLAFRDWPGVLRGAAVFSELQIRGHVTAETLNGQHVVKVLLIIQ